MMIKTNEKLNLQFHEQSVHKGVFERIKRAKFDENFEVKCIFPDCTKSFYAEDPEHPFNQKERIRQRCSLHLKMHYGEHYRKCSLCGWRGISYNYVKARIVKVLAFYSPKLIDRPEIRSVSRL